MKTNWWYMQFIGQVGFVIIVPLLLGGFIGSSIDNRFQSHPIATLLSLLIGFIVSVYNLIIMVQKIISEKN